MNRTFLLQQVLNGLAIGSVYAIFALGYTLIFSVLRIINFTHGAIFTIGAYATYALTGSQFGINGLLAGAALPFALPFVLALLGGSVVAAVSGVIVERLAFRPLRGFVAPAWLLGPGAWAASRCGSRFLPAPPMVSPRATSGSMSSVLWGR